MLREFLAWYTQQLRELLPAALTASLATPDAVLVRAGRAGGLELRLRRAGRVSALGPLDETTVRRLGRHRPALVALELPAAALLERDLTLPLAAENGHQAVLGYEMDRYTPFRADDLVWTSRIARRDRARGKLLIRLSLVPKTALAPLLERLAAAGLAPARIEAGGTVLDLAPGRRAGSRGLRAAAIGCAALAVIAIALPFFRQWQETAAVENRIALLEPRVAEAAAIRRRIADRTTGASALAGEQARVGDALGVLATITRTLPDDASLTGLTLQHRRLLLDGQAGSAASLIPLLAAAPGIRDPSFAAPVTRDGSGRAEIFSIRAEIVP
jgi:general secretion pathway protein L